MDRGEYQERKNELKWQRRLFTVTALVSCLTVIGLPIGLWLFRKADRAKDEQKELEREYEDYLDTKGQTAAV